MTTAPPEDDTGRLEAFSDGVFAIAITLLILDVRVPARDALHGESLTRALGHEWPSFFAYVVSFLVIGIIWVNHHGMFRLIERVDRVVLFANLLLLLVVATIPFPTALLAEYLTAGRDSHIAAAVYSATMLVLGVTFSGLWLAATRRPGLLRNALDPVVARLALRRFSLGNVVYAATIGVAFISAPLTLIAHAVIALYYCFDQLSVPDPEPAEQEPAEPGAETGTGPGGLT